MHYSVRLPPGKPALGNRQRSAPPDRTWTGNRSGEGIGKPARPDPTVKPKPIIGTQSAYTLTVSRSFDSLCRVLFTFRSHYLFAIGLPDVFSLGWILPPYSDCTRKQPYSWIVTVGLRPSVNGALTLFGPGFSPVSDQLAENGVPIRRPQLGRPAGTSDSVWASPCSLAATKGIPVGFFSSA